MKHTEEATRIVRETLGFRVSKDSHSIEVASGLKIYSPEAVEAYNALISTTEELLAAKEQVAEMRKRNAYTSSVLQEMTMHYHVLGKSPKHHTAVTVHDCEDSLCVAARMAILKAGE